MFPQPTARLAAVVMAALLSGSASAEDARPKAGLLPIQNQAGRADAAQVLESSLRVELGWEVSLIDPDHVRNTMRRFRIRDLDQAPPAQLTRASELAGARWLISATVHDADDRDVPTMAASVRVYDGASGEIIWSLFRAASGLDQRTVLGLGVVTDLGELSSRVGESLAADLLRDLVNPGQPGAVLPSDRRTAEERWVVIPFSGRTEKEAFANSETVSNLVRTNLLEMRAAMVSPNVVRQAMGRLRRLERGGISDELREALHRELGAEAIVTGAVENYDLGGFRGEPRPYVAISMRLIDGATGRILWTGAIERSGWDRPWPLALGRTYSRGGLAEEVGERLLGQMMNQRHPQMQ